MNIAEAILILRKVKAHCPSQLIDEYTPEAWAEVLDDVSFRDANDAVVAICKRPLEAGKSRYIEPGHIIGEISTVRRKRVLVYGAAAMPPDELPDAYYSEYMTQIRDLVADGVLTKDDPPPSFASLKPRIDALRSAQQERLALAEAARSKDLRALVPDTPPEWWG